jgi:hypothetical protein
VGNIDFEVISATKNSNKFFKTRFWKEKSIEDMVTLGPKAQATLVTMKSASYIGLYIGKACFYYLPSNNLLVGC